MGKKKASANFSGIAMGIGFVCIVAWGVGVVVIREQEKASGGTSLRVGMLEAGYEELRAQVVAQAYGPALPPPAPASHGPIIRVERNGASADPLIFTANAQHLRCDRKI